MTVRFERTRRQRRFVSLAVLILLMANTSARAEDGPQIHSADFIKDAAGQAYVAVSFSLPFKPEHEARILDRRNYRVSRIGAGRAGNDRFLGIEKVTIDPEEDFDSSTPNRGRSSVRIYLAGPYDFLPGETITVYYLGVGADGKMVFADKDLKTAMVTAVTVPKPDDVAQTSGPGRPGAQPNPQATNSKRTPAGTGFALKAAKGRDDADIYFSGDINRASGTNFTGSADLKIQIPVVSTATHTVLPRLDLKASNDPKSDPDSIKAGLDWDWVLATAGLELPERSPLSGILWRNSGGVEGNRDFDNVNLIWSTQALFRLKNLWFSRERGDSAYAVIIPQLGAEVGKNLMSPVQEAEGRGVARLLAGSSLYVRLYQGAATFARVTLDGLYQRRWPLQSEVGFRDITVKDANGKDVKKTVPAFFGKAPRQWADVKINYNFTDYFGLFVGYQYGQLPPAYKLVDHAFKFGIVLKAKLK